MPCALIRFRRSPFALLAALITGWTLLQTATAVQAAVYTWDTVAGGGVTGGSGTWNTSNTNWTTNGGATNVSWPATGTDNDATFSGTAGTVTIAAGGVTANDLTFSSSGYSIQGAVLTLNGTTPTLTAPAAATTAAISSEIAGSSGLRLTRSGSNISSTNFVVTLSGANSYTGTTVVQGAGAVSGIINLTLNTAGANGTTVVAVPGDLTLNSATGTVNSSAWVNLAASNQVAFSSTVNFSGTSAAFAQIFLNNNHQTFAAINDSSSFGSIANNNNGVGGGTSISTLTINGSTTSNYNGFLRNNAGGGSGQLALVKDGTGTLNLTGATGRTIYTGGTTIRGGVLSLSSSVMGDTAFSAANPITFDTGGTGAATLQWNGVNTVDLSSKIKINDGAAARIDTNGNNVTFASALQLGTLKTGALTKVGAGTLTLGAANTYTGGTNINAGTLLFSITNGIGTGAITFTGASTLGATANSLSLNNAVTVNPGVTATALTTGSINLTFAGQLSGAGTLQTATGGSLFGVLFSGNNSAFTGTLRAQSGGTIRFNALNGAPANATLEVAAGGAMTLNASGGGTYNLGHLMGAGDISTSIAGTHTLSVGALDQSVNFGGVISNGIGTFALTKVGSGTLTLTGANSYTGATTISNGTLEIGNGGSTGTLGTGAVVNNAILAFNRSNALTISNVISGSGAVQQLGAGTTTLDSANSYTGATTINAGTLQVNADGAISASSPVTVNSGGTLRVTSVRGINTGGMLTVNDGGTVFINNNAPNVRLDLATVNMTGGSITGAANANVFSGLAGTTASGLTFNIFANAAPSIIDTIRLQTNQNASGSGLMTFNVANGGQANVSSIIYDGAQGVATAMTKSGGGILRLTAANSYSGATTVSAGTLLANNTSGSATGTSVVSVNGGVFGGSGAVSGAITVNSGGTLAPGASIQTLAGGALTFNNNSTFAYEIDSAAATSAAGDLQIANGALSLNGVVNLTLTDLSPSQSSLLPINTTLTLINYSGLWNGGLFSLGGNELSDGEIFTAGKYLWQIDYDALSDGANFASEQIYNNHVNITLLALSLPEPSTWGLALCGVSLLAWRLQRKRKFQA